MRSSKSFAVLEKLIFKSKSDIISFVSRALLKRAYLQNLKILNIENIYLNMVMLCNRFLEVVSH